MARSAPKDTVKSVLPKISKRTQDELEEESDDEINVSGLLDVEASDDEEEEEEEEDSDAELEKLLGEEDDMSDYDSEDFSDEPNDDSRSITDKLSNIKLRRLSSPNDADNKEIETTYSDGRFRIIKPEIEPVYDSDDSDHDNFNTIGNVPLAAYDEMPHIGYDINGKRIMRPARGSALDQLLESIDLPEGWTGLLDQNTGSSLNLTNEELELIDKIQKNQMTDESINPYEPTIEWFTSRTEVMPLQAIPEPKRRFVPSKHEAKRIMKIVRAIREGRIVLPSQAKKDEDEDFNKEYEIWDDNDTENNHIMNLRAPQRPPPKTEESYNPPAEYLLTEEEKKAWEEMDPSERATHVIPQKFDAFRKVPAYRQGVTEMFERQLDLYLAPRVRHNKLNIDPESLIPDLPDPSTLKPYPIMCSTVYEGHEDKIRTISIDPTGLWLATGSDDGSVRIWEILTGRQVYKLQLIDKKENTDDHIDSLEWNPDANSGILAIACGERVYLIVPPIFGFDIENAGKLRIESGFGYDVFGKKKHTDLNVNQEQNEEINDEVEEPKKKTVAKWIKPTTEQAIQGISIYVETRKSVKKISWHRKGDYFITVSPDSANTSVLIHQLSKHSSQAPFRKSKGIIVDAKFHPSKPQIFVASQRYVRIYDLAQQVLQKKLMPGARWLSSIDIHPRGDNLIASSYDKRVLWHDLDLSTTPYKTLRYHEKAVRAVAFHKGGYPLLCSASDDGSINVLHGKVSDDFMQNPVIVPLKKLTGHKVVNSLGVLDVVWHPKEAWLFSAGADGKARLWTT